MTADELAYLSSEPMLLPVYTALRRHILHLYPESEIRVQKTTISFRHPMPYCYVSLPVRHLAKVRPDKYLAVSLLLGERLRHERIAQCTEAYPGRFTHHLMVSRPDEVDEQLLDWVQQSHAFRFMVTGGKARN